MPKFGLHHSRAAKLTGMQVIAIRERYAAGETQGSLARSFDVTVVTIGRIVRGESWRHLQTIADPLVIDKPVVEWTPEMKAKAGELERQTLARMTAEVTKAVENKRNIREFLGGDEVAKRTANYGAIHHAERKDDDSRGRADNQDQPQGQGGAEQEQKE